MKSRAQFAFLNLKMTTRLRKYLSDKAVNSSEELARKQDDNDLCDDYLLEKRSRLPLFGSLDSSTDDVNSIDASSEDHHHRVCKKLKVPTQVIDSQQLTQPKDMPEISPSPTWEGSKGSISEPARTLESYQKKKVNKSQKRSDYFFMVKPGQGLVQYWINCGRLAAPISLKICGLSEIVIHRDPDGNAKKLVAMTSSAPLAEYVTQWSFSAGPTDDKLSLAKETMLTGSFRSLAIFGDSIFTGDLKGVINEWSVTDLRLRRTWGECHNETIINLVVVPEVKKMFSFGRNGGFKEWCLKKKTLLQPFNYKSRESKPPLDRDPIVKANAKYLFMLFPKAENFYQWDIAAGSIKHNWGHGWNMMVPMKKKFIYALTKYGD
jgi:hypothetical protein